MEPKKLGPYQLSRMIGRGGMGAVFEAHEETSGERVAVKLLKASKTLDEGFRRRFEAEITTLIHLDHPHIVNIKSHGQEQGHLFFAMELVDGQSLHDQLKSRGALPWAEVVAYMLDICEGLRHAHDRGFIHRDLKPGNLLVNQKNQVLITDFGIARDTGLTRDQFREQMTSPGGVVGTLDYMSPEQLLGQPATQRSDLYSLGCVMYALLAARTPFSFKTVSEAQRTLESTTPTPVGSLVPDLPSELERIVMRLLEFDPKKRFGSARALSKRLQEFLEQRGQQSILDTSSGTDESDEFKLQDDFEIHSQKTEMIPDMSAARETAPSTGSSSEISDLELAPASDKATKQVQQTVVADLTTWGKPKQRDYFAPVTSDDREATTKWLTDSDRREGPIWPYALGLVGVIFVLLIALYFAIMWQPSADSLYAKIQTSIDQGNSLEEVESEISRFLETYPDDERAAEIQQLDVELNADSLPGKLELRARMLGPSRLSDLEREFLATYRLAPAEPEAALARFSALKLIFADADSDSDKTCLVAVNAQIAKLSSLVDSLRKRRLEQIQTEIATQKTTDTPPAETRERLDALRLIYGNDPVLAAELDHWEQSLKSNDPPNQ